MPMYLGEPISDEDLQALITAYCDGQRALGHTPPGSDQPVINRLEECGIVDPVGADVVGRYDVIPSEVTEPDKQGDDVSRESKKAR
jgi:hypothetical protein